MKTTRALLLAATAGLAGGVAIAWFTRPAPPAAGAEALTADIGDHRPGFRHAGIDGRIWQASDFDGRWLMINFWATWCAPCVREMPLLQQVDDATGEALAIIGIAIDEPGEVRGFVERLGVRYPILIGTSDVRETRNRYGNPEGLLPYTVLVDRDGTIRWRHLGELDRSEIDQALAEAGFGDRSPRP